MIYEQLKREGIRTTDPCFGSVHSTNRLTSDFAFQIYQKLRCSVTKANYSY